MTCQADMIPLFTITLRIVSSFRRQAVKPNSFRPQPDTNADEDGNHLTFWIDTNGAIESPTRTGTHLPQIVRRLFRMLLSPKGGALHGYATSYILLAKSRPDVDGGSGLPSLW